MASEVISECLILKPPSLFTPQWPYQSKIAGSGPGRAGGNGTAMAVPVFEEEKMASLGFLTYAYVIEWPLRAVRRRLGRLRGLLRTFSSLQASKVATLELRFLNFLRYLSARRDANWGGANMRASCVAVISGS